MTHLSIRFFPIRSIFLVNSVILYFVYKVEHGFATASVLKESSTTATVEEDIQHLGIFDVDPSLGQFKDHFVYRWKKYIEQKSLIEKYEGSLEEFALG